MRSSILVFASILSLAAACGGATTGGPGGGGGGASSGSGSGSSSGSSGGSGSSGAGSSSGFGSSGGGGSSGASSSGLGPNCPVNPPSAQTGCSVDGTTCDYGSAEGCGETCTCQNGLWFCEEPPCIMETCPPEPPQDGSVCQEIDATCGYASKGVCGGEQCTCDPSGTWSCDESGCADAGPPTDAGFAPDSSEPPCPPSEPAANAPCPVPGIVCSYDTGAETNCLCAQDGWVCATQ